MNRNWLPLFPFGVCLEGESVGSLSAKEISQRALTSKVVVLKNVSAPKDEELIQFAESFRDVGYGGILDWNGQKLFYLQQDLKKDNYIFSHERVPLHWDGAFHIEPSFLVFYCDEATDNGGETIFTDTCKVHQDLSDELDFASIRLEISTEKKAHYGGKKDLPILIAHPRTRLPTLRIAESVHTERNPVTVRYYSENTPDLSSDLIESSLMNSCYKTDSLLQHKWQPGDLVIVDNHALVHGRNSFQQNADRRIRRVQIL